MSVSKPNRPIGIFDSGLGGLTVFAEVKKRLPNESILYLGDTARVPYGTKSPETIIRYSLECASFLEQRGVKAIVVACNTASALALPALQAKFDLPLIGVVGPGATDALKTSQKRAIGVIGTTATIASDAYARALKQLDGHVRVVSQACPLFVPLVEEGWLDNEVSRAAAKRYLGGMKEEGIDVVILGCTHYPLLKPIIRETLGDDISLIDSAEATARALESILQNPPIPPFVKGGDNSFPPLVKGGEGGFGPTYQIYVTDLPGRFEMVARRFLGDDIPQVRHVTL